MNENKDEIEILVYEAGYHLVSTVDESEVLVYSSKIKSLIEGGGGVIISEEMPKSMVLAYEISKSVNTKKQKFSKSYFGWVKFEMDPTHVLNLKNKIESLPEVLRLLVIKTVKENTISTPKIPMFRRENSKEGSLVTSKNFPVKTEEAEKVEISEEEIDKSIDELVDKQTL